MAEGQSTPKNPQNQPYAPNYGFQIDYPGWSSAIRDVKLAGIPCRGTVELEASALMFCGDVEDVDFDPRDDEFRVVDASGREMKFEPIDWFLLHADDTEHGAFAQVNLTVCGVICAATEVAPLVEKLDAELEAEYGENESTESAD